MSTRSWGHGGLPLAALLAVGCWSNAPPQAPATQQGGPLTQLGSLTSVDGAWTVTAERSSSSLVDFTIADSATGAEYAAGGGFSDAQRWFLFWDAQNRLWSYNSDVGPLGVWTHNGASAFTFQPVRAGGPLAAAIPPEVAAALPSSVLQSLRSAP
ncbi:hypothetical protein KOR34_50270 [Posidoniimonas corsicana]|uniref:Uncharacterized protein n=1 Tax=Posidoniimonas corsicana TaxID=1938618 RepID=A0A5C5UWB9_9BACT|nr:hypothetical protein [Posidoniimonas corsicana]TWT30468.1 hypothetical protein KOR34_50270 [Posidoniimonas corsicana]